MTKAKNTKITASTTAEQDTLTHIIAKSLHPLLNLLDGEVPEGLTTGHDLPSMRDMGLRIYLGQVIQTFHNQLFGFTTGTGKTYQGAMNFLSEAEYRVNSPGFIQRAEQDNLSENDMKAFHFLQINEARVAMITEHMNAFKEIYKGITHEDWKPYEATGGVGGAVAKKASTDEIKAKLAEMRGKRPNA